MKEKIMENAKPLTTERKKIINSNFFRYTCCSSKGEILIIKR